MHNYLKIVLLVIALHCSGTISAQPGMQYWNTESGLSNNMVSQVLQDQEGYIWLATQYGLNRFDGYEFKQFRYQPNKLEGLSGNSIKAIAQDSSGLLWLAIDVGGIHAFDPKSGKAKRYPLLLKRGGELKNIDCIHVAADQSVWVGTRHKLFRKNADENHFQPVNITLENDQSVVQSGRFAEIKEDHQGNIYILTSYCIYKFIATSQTYQKIYAFEYRTLRNIHIDQDGAIWGVNSNELFQLNYTNGSWIKEVIYTADFRIDSGYFDTPIYQSSKNELWIATNDGLIILNKERKVEKRMLLETLFPSWEKPASITSFFEDQHQNMWMGTKNGLLLLSPFSKRFQAQQRFSWIGYFEAVKAIQQVGKLYFISDPSGTFVVDSSQENPNPQKISETVTHEFLLTKSGDLYGVGKKLLKIQLPNLQIEEIPLERLSWFLDEDDKGNIWITFVGDALLRFNPATKEIKTIPSDMMPFPPDQDVLIDSQDRLWVGDSWRGILLSENISSLPNDSLPKFRHFKYDEHDLNSLSTNSIISMLEDLEGNI